MGGASSVLAGDTKEEIIEKAKKWYLGAYQAGLYPRRYIYEPNTSIEFFHCKKNTCPLCGGEVLRAYVTIADIEEKPEDAESDLPFTTYSEALRDEDKEKRFFGFVSAHA